jgi:hypothetical protein
MLTAVRDRPWYLMDYQNRKLFLVHWSLLISNGKGEALTPHSESQIDKDSAVFNTWFLSADIDMEENPVGNVDGSGRKVGHINSIKFYCPESTDRAPQSPQFPLLQPQTVINFKLSSFQS